MDHFEKIRTDHERWAAQWPASSRARQLAGRWYDSATGQSRAAWGVARSLRCGTVSNTFVLLSPV